MAHRILAMMLVLAMFGLLAPVGTSHQALEEDSIPEAHGHIAQTGPRVTTPPDDELCLGLPLTPGLVFPIVLGNDALVLQVDTVEAMPDNLVAVDDGQGGIRIDPEPSNISLVRGQVLNVAGAAFYLTVSEIGLDGLITLDENRTWSIAAAGTPHCGLANLWFDLAHYIAPPEVSIAATTSIKTFLVLSSDFDGAHSCAVCIANNIYNRMNTNYVNKIGQGHTYYTSLTSTSLTTDTALGIHGANGGQALFNWAGYMSGRSDHSSWDQAVLITSHQGNGNYDGRAYLAGRYSWMAADTNSFTAQSNDYYHYTSTLMTHEMGHNFQAPDIFNQPYYTYKDTCVGPIYLQPVLDLCVGYSSGCDSPVTTTLVTDSQGRGLCVGPSPQEIDGTYFWLMDTNSVHDPSNDSFWTTNFRTDTSAYMNGCFPTWHNLPYTRGNHGC